MAYLKSHQIFIKCKYILIVAIAFFLSLGGCDKKETHSTKTYKIAVTHSNDRFNPFFMKFKKHLAELGYKEGQNTIFLYDGPVSEDQLEEQLTYLKSQDIDLLYTISTPASRLAHKIFKGSGVPILFGPVFSPIDAGLTSSLTAPDKNMTGVMVRGSIPKAFGFLKESIPTLKNISVPLAINEKTARLSVKDLKENATKFGVNINTWEMRNKEDLNNYLRQLTTETEAIWIPHSPFLMDNITQISATATAKKIPLASANPQRNSNIMLTYGPELDSLTKQLARLAGKLLQGTPPANLPIEHCEYSLSINLEIAKQTNINIPDNVLRQATVVKITQDRTH